MATRAALAPACGCPFSDARVEGTVGQRLLRAAQKAAVEGGGKAGHASAMKYGLLLVYIAQFGKTPPRSNFGLALARSRHAAASGPAVHLCARQRGARRGASSQRRPAARRDRQGAPPRPPLISADLG